MRTGALACLVALSACTAGPDFRQADVQARIASFEHAAEHKDAVAVRSRAVEQEFDPEWWKLFNDPLLVELEREAIASNLDLQGAAARVAQSRAALRVSGATLLPTIGANASHLRERASDEGIMALTGTAAPLSATAANGGDPFGANSLPGATGSPPYSLWQYGFDASWELDLWGRARRMKESSAAQVEAAHFDAAAYRVSITAEVARVYLELRRAQSDLRIARSNAEVAAKSVQLANRRREQGVATQFDTSVSAALLASVEASIPELEQRRDVLMNALAMLLAKSPRALDARLTPQDEIAQLPAQVPVGLPSELARRRPDILRAEAQLHAATAAIGVAKADFYPSISLTGSLGFQSLSLSKLGEWGARQFAVGPVLHLPIFEGGRLSGNLALTEARQQEVAISYQRTVLAAWHEVDNALTAYRALQQRADRLEAAVGQNRLALAHAERRYTQGAADYLNVLVVQQRLLDSENAASRGRTNIALAMVTLYKALGGGWQPAQPQAVDGKA